MKKLLFLFAASLVMACAEEPKEPIKPQLMPLQQVLPQVWKYETATDDMSMKEMDFASTYSTSKVQFEFPHAGGSSFRLTARSMDGKTELMLEVDKGQFMATEDSVYLKFDGGAVLPYEFTTTKTMKSNTVFLHPADVIIDQLKHTAKLKVKAPFFDAGYKVISFDVYGLKWTH